MIRSNQSMHPTRIARRMHGRFSRTNLSVRASSLNLYDDDYKGKLNRSSKCLGTETVHLNWKHETGEDDLLEMTKAFTRKANSLENVSKVMFEALHLPLDGRFITEIGLNMSQIKELHITAWTFHSPDRTQWKNSPDAVEGLQEAQEALHRSL